VSIRFTVYIKIKPGFWEEFLAATRANQAGARQEPGNRRFDIFRSTETPSYFLLVEEYESDEAIGKHRETPHYVKWQATVEPMMVEPRQRVPGNDVPAGYEEV
jgi:autoinducer 2-degrading protein